MAKYHKPRAGSKGYSPRVRAKKQTPTIGRYPAIAEPSAMGFLCYKAGMTHVIAKDLTKNSPTHNMDVRIPVTVLDCPPLIVFGIRAYAKGYNRLEALTDVYSEKLDKDLARAMSVPKEVNNADKIKLIEGKMGEIAKFVLLVHTQPKKTGFRKKTPEVMELGVGGDVAAQWVYCKEMLGKSINIKDVFSESEYVDVLGVTKGKGFQGPVKRWGVKIQKRKAKRSGHMRHVGSIGAWSPSNLRWLTPMAGRMGYHNRTEFNKSIVKIGDKGEEINPAGGFVSYGLVNGDYVLIKGSIPGPRKRAVALRKAIRPPKRVPSVSLDYISTVSQQCA